MQSIKPNFIVKPFKIFGLSQSRDRMKDEAIYQTDQLLKTILLCVGYS